MTLNLTPAEAVAPPAEPLPELVPAPGIHLSPNAAEWIATALHRAGIALPEPLAAVLPPPAEDAEQDGRHPLTVRLTGHHLEYLTARAKAHGDTPARHLETILRTFRAHHDPARYGLDTQPDVPGVPAGTRRRA